MRPRTTVEPPADYPPELLKFDPADWPSATTYSAAYDHWMRARHRLAKSLNPTGDSRLNYWPGPLSWLGMLRQEYRTRRLAAAADRDGHPPADWNPPDTWETEGQRLTRPDHPREAD